MNKSELMEGVAERADLPRAHAEAVVKEIFAAMTEALVSGEGVEIRGFGSFVVKSYRPYTGRNPKTGEKIPVAPKKLPFFKVGKELRERVQRGRGS
ncbi:integration host factor subunit beta [Dissulfurirhabdus thermomarina]|uniref:Integration host factor subunit beta n=1 Tax=Dissulfurirhabdus thermomarina TaxID=1765737 RepID=A0A6N9TL28_DISTH|nr:HU family DNA-binding protein [Dissulfurirhabdus thermomarina]NDY41971.1 integration host factor subunit beta [Dissulfurirhabdus thermomarina]NMX22806.1 integration host factor subunit beta [Dissulfurirhabdus thermomarina]